MRISILLIGSILISLFAFGETNITYKIPTAYEEVSAGNIYFESHGYVDARKVCYDRDTHLFKTTIPATMSETCSLKGLIVSLCTQEGGRIIYTPVPAHNLTAPEKIMVKTCVRYDHSVSISPSCAEYATIEKAQPLDFTFMKYEMAITPEQAYINPKTYEVRDMSYCQ